jgi:DNA replication protein DnaC
MEKINGKFLPKGAQVWYQKLPITPESATYTCEVCGNLVEAHKVSFGEDTRYSRTKCPCRVAEEKRLEQEKIRAEILDTQSRHTYSWLGSRWSDAILRQKSFKNFDQSKQVLAYEAARMFAENPDGALVLYGTYGTGKTHLLAAICNTALYNKKRPIYSLFATSPKLFAAIQERIQRNEEYFPLIERAIQTPLLVLDDIDKAKWTEFREEIYFSIIDERVKSGRPTAISTNRLDDLSTFVGGAVCSRLKIGQVEVEMVGADYREEL